MKPNKINLLGFAELSPTYKAERSRPL